MIYDLWSEMESYDYEFRFSFEKTTTGCIYKSYSTYGKISVIYYIVR